MCSFSVLVDFSVSFVFVTNSWCEVCKKQKQNKNNAKVEDFASLISNKVNLKG